MSGPGDSRVEDDAAALGAIARRLDGRVPSRDGDAGRERLLGTLARSDPAPSRLRYAWALVPALALVLAVYFAALKPVPLAYHVEGPIAETAGWLAPATDHGALSVRFSEGTELGVGPGSKCRIEDVTSDGAHIVLGGGQLQARVVHKPKTRWVVAAGPFSVEVTGTAFDVDWQANGERLELTLHDGSVIVRGPWFRDGIRVVAGQRLVANARTNDASLSSTLAAKEAPSAPETLDEKAPEEATEPHESEPSPGTLPQKSAPTWTELVREGQFRTVLDAARARGVDATLSRGSLADLVAVADAARYAGDTGLARRALLSERTRFPSSSEAHAATFVLGRLADDAGSSGEALRYYDEYLSTSPRGALASEAMGRKLVVLVKQGNTELAKQLAATYLKRFPRGGHAAYARELVTGP